MNPHFMAHLNSLSSSGLEIEIEIQADAEADEFFSYIWNKKMRDGQTFFFSYNSLLCRRLAEKPILGR
ncbi:MAG: hypothetical protein ACTFAL_09235 [Candidatus Electronema sp. V4]|uniref:hypothetical protein n=1 Tax=Candidatus Electronema sp. V4 TaxID=3454756 RepID=UPI004055964C